MQTRVVVTGLGCISPLGNDVNSTWQNILDGKSGITKITHFDASELKTQIAAEVKDYRPADHFDRKNARRTDRYAQFALVASRQALADSHLQLKNINLDRVGAIIGSGIGGVGTIYEQAQVLFNRGPSRISPFFIPMMLADSAGGLLAIEFGIRGPNWTIVTACATGTNAIGEAAEIIRRGQADVIFAGAAEASIVPLTMAGMDSMTAMSTYNQDPQSASKPFDLNRDGFVMGEGSAVLILENLDHAKARDAKIYAEVLGYGSTNDAYHITAPAENGAGAVKCMQMALDSAKLQPQEIGYINAHGTSTPLNDKNETAAIKSVFGDYAFKIPVSSTKSMTGHMMGASGALEALFCIQSLQTHSIPPTINYTTPDPECDLDYVPNQKREMPLNFVMSNSFGFGGHNATIIFGKPKEANL